jgi:signal transduction histidine kinase
MTLRSLLAAGLYLVPAALYTEIARQHWIFRRARRPTGRLFQLMPIASTVLAFHYGVLIMRALVPGALSPNPMQEIATPWHGEIEVSWLVAIVFMRHVLKLTPLPESPPSTAWLLGNYGVGIGGALLLLTLRLWPHAGVTQQVIGHRVFELTFAILAVLSFSQLRAVARPGGWGPEHAGEIRGPDVRLVRFGSAAAFFSVPIVSLAGGGEFALVSFEVLMGLTIAAPMATRMAGQVLPETIVTYVIFVAGAAIVAGYTLAIPQVAATFHPLIGAIVVTAMLALATTGQRLARLAVTRVLFGRHERQAMELQAFLQSLSGGLGVVECCRRALVELTRVRGLPGAAIIFADGDVLVCGSFDVEGLRRVWPTGAAAAALPAGGYGTVELRELPLALREALVQSEVGLGAAAIRSHRRHWGHLFMRTGFFGGTFREDDAEAFHAFVDQLALVLDAADLLARTIDAERALAHAEKLAAIGELAARFAHEIRNPVTAARSLAQQLARDPTSALNAEHAGVILEELERVERQVRELLRFARHEELSLAPTDVSRLVGATAHAFADRLAEAGIEVGLDIADDVVARADGEKVRRVLVNLIENAMDALRNGRPEKHLHLAVGRDGDRAFVRVADDGAGIPTDAQPRIFDPFVSLKPSGTGLGLAIAKRIVDAHGGTITLTSRPGATAFEVRLPLAPEAAP